MEELECLERNIQREVHVVICHIQGKMCKFVVVTLELHQRCLIKKKYPNNKERNHKKAKKKITEKEETLDKVNSYCV